MTAFKKFTAYSDAKFEWVSTTYPYNEENAQLKEENTKLRDLAARMFRTIKWNDRMSDSMYWPSLSYERELHELGMEVDK